MYKRVFEVADRESCIRIWKIKMADSIWRLFLVKIAVFWVIYLEKGIREYKGLLITNINSEFRYSKCRTQYRDYFRLDLQFYMSTSFVPGHAERRELERCFLWNQQYLIRFNLWGYDLRYQIRYLNSGRFELIL